MTDELIRLSKYLSLILRHKPETIGLHLDDAGWALIADVIDGCKMSGTAVTCEQLRLIVESSDKQRFALSADGTRIRANQGHSLDVDLGYTAAAPPALLFHGTATRFLDSIKLKGLLKQSRHHVHLTESRDVASAVGSRYGKLCLLIIHAERMNHDGHEFFRSDNAVWLTDRVPAEYIDFPEHL